MEPRRRRRREKNACDGHLSEIFNLRDVKQLNFFKKRKTTEANKKSKGQKKERGKKLEYTQQSKMLSETGRSLTTTPDWCQLLCSLKLNFGPKACKL